MQKAYSDPKRGMTSLTNSDYQLVLDGKKELSNGPRAVKRRALKMCKEDDARKQIVIGEGYLQEKECINR